MTQAQQEIQQQAGKLLAQVAGYVSTRTLEMGLRLGLFERLAQHPDGLTPEGLAKDAGLDPFYVGVWCRSAYGAELLEQGDGPAYTLAPHLDKLLLDEEFPGYLGGLPLVMMQPEMFDRFAQNLPSGEGLWWDQCSQEFIRLVSSTGRPFYKRLLAGGLARIPGLEEQLEGGGKVMDLACGAGFGLTYLAQAFPECTLVGVDGDAYSLSLTAERLRENGLEQRTTLIQSTLEDIDAADEFDAVIINISMHECRDIERVAANVHRALKPGGHFVISDFPFPEGPDAYRTVPARIMMGIQFFEALIGDQLLPTKAYVELLGRHGFRNVDAFDLTPVHAVTHGQK